MTKDRGTTTIRCVKCTRKIRRHEINWTLRGAVCPACQPAPEPKRDARDVA